ncbi:MAG: hypothetical protein HZB91_11855 [Elusimicrobia bacterium]|nr:hypothetical protein [Elusimicrobiota bacterium]
MNRLLAVIAVTFVFGSAAPASAQRQLPQWQPKVESHSYWQEFSFTDEAGYRHTAYCYYPSCKVEGEGTQANIYELTMIDRKEIKDGSLHHYSSKLSPYILTRPAPTGFWSKKYSQWKVTSASDAKFSADMVPAGPAFVPPNFQFVVMAPTEILPTGTQMKAEKERVTKEAAAKAEQERLAKEKKAEQDRIAKEKKAEQERLAKEAAAEKDRLAKEAAAEKDRIAKEAAERERVARENAAKQPQPTPGKQPEPGKDQPVAANELTPFEIVVLKAGETAPEKVKIDEALKAKGTKEYDNFVVAAKIKVMNKAKAYVHPSWQPKNPNAAKVWNRFDAMEQDYIKERIKDVGPDAQAVFDKQLEAAGKDPKKAEDMVSTYRSFIKEEFTLYTGAQGGRLAAKEQLERMSEIMKRVEGAKTIEDGKQVLDTTTSGKGSDQTVDKGPTGEQAANSQLPGKPNPNLANNPPKKKPLGVPKIGKDEGKEGAAEKTDTKLWVRRIGSTAMAGIAFAIIGSIFGAPLLMGLLGIGLGILYNYAQDA